MLDQFADQSKSLPELDAQVSEVRDENIMIDPSLFLSRKTYKQIRKIVISKESGSLYLPSSFVSGLETKDSQLLSFYLGRAKAFSLATLLRDIKTSNRIQLFPMDPHDNRYSQMSSFLQEHFGKGKLADSLMEEWIFLQTQSWIVSRSDKAMRVFINQGATALETSKEMFDQLVAITLKISHRRAPTNKERLRAAAKWIAFGCPSFISIYAPELERVFDVASGFFLLVDP